MQTSFPFKEAIKIIDSYFYLTRREVTEDREAYYLCVAPANEDQYTRFISYLIQTANPPLALSKAGYDRSGVRILLIHHDTVSHEILAIDLDEYLTRNRIDKVYDRNGTFCNMV